MIQFDVLGLDRDLRRVEETRRRWRRGIDRGEALAWDPFATLPDVARQATFEAVGGLEESDPLRRPLQRWVYRLTEQRINRQGLAHLSWLRHHVRHGLHEPVPGDYTTAELISKVLCDAPRRDAWVEALQNVGNDLSRGEGLLWERRQEIASRLGIESPDGVECPNAQLGTAAEQWLDASDELFADLGIGSWGSWFHVALGLDSTEGWPARSNPRTFTNLLRETTWLDRESLDPGELPTAIAPVSFLRGLAQVGVAWGEALAPQRQPFVIGHDPYGWRNHSFGTRFASLPLHPAFAKRTLGIGAPRIRDHIRGVARMLLLATRVSAARVLLRQAALKGTNTLREAYPETVRRACGLPLPPQLSGVVFRLDVTDPARFAGLLHGSAAVQQHAEDYDDDWFRNPRAAEALRDEADLSPPPTITSEELAHGVTALATRLRATW